MNRDEVAFADWASAQSMGKYGAAIAIPIARPWGLSHFDRNIPKLLGSADAVKKPPAPGSCIFLHASNTRDGTNGSTTMAARDFEELLRWLDEGKYPVLIQLSQSEYDRLRATYHLP